MKNTTYCDFEDFAKQYRQYIHGYLSLCVCVFGSMANVFNICVLRSKTMRSPTNYILTGLAFADLLVMVHYIPFTIHRNLPSSPLHFSHFSYGWAMFYKFYSLSTLVLHFIACTLTIILAVWRYVFVTQVHTNRICSNQNRTLAIIFVTYFACPLICFPILSTLEIVPYQQTCDLEGYIVSRNVKHKYNKSELKNETIYFLYPKDPYDLSIWMYTVLLKFIPCILLTVITFKIMSALVETRRRRMKLMNCNNRIENTNATQTYKTAQSDRTTRMLLVVLILFLLTEFPQAIMGLISALLGDTFLAECYAPLGDVMDIMALINSSINFVLYCSMSRQFRKTFKEMFRLESIIEWLRKPSLSNTLIEETRAETKMSLV